MLMPRSEPNISRNILRKENLMNLVREISVPVISPIDWWKGTSHVRCSCGGWIEWAEAGYVSGSRACRACLTLYSIRGDAGDRRLVPQACLDSGIIGDAPNGVDPDDLYRVPKNLYPGWYQSVTD